MGRFDDDDPLYIRVEKEGINPFTIAGDFRADPDACVALEEILKYVEDEKRVAQQPQSDGIHITIEMFTDENIEETIKTYNDDYGKLTHMMLCLLSTDEVDEITADLWHEYSMFPEDYFDPERKTFEIIRKSILEKLRGKRKGL